MMDHIERIYFETSAVNYLFDNIFNDHQFSSVKTKELQISKGRKWQISNIVLWEIFLTKDEKRRYDLLDFSRCLFFDDLISSPEEIIIDYIKSGSPIVQKQYDLRSNSIFSKEWSVACKNLDYAFQPDREQLESFTQHFRFYGEYFIKTSKGYSLKSFDRIDEFSEKINGAYLKSLFERVLKLYGKNADDDAKNYISISIQITMIILCYGIGFDQPTIERFWNKNRNIEPLERIDIVINDFPNIFFRGPIANISKMIYLQCKNKGSRGLYFDSLHSIYTTYSDLYVSDDDHFLNFRKENTRDPNMKKVMSVSELNFN